MTANGMIPGQRPPTRCAVCGRPYQVRGAQICPSCMDAILDSDPGEEFEIVEAQREQAASEGRSAL